MWIFMPLVGLYLVNKVSSSFIHVYISKRQCMRDTGSDECQILLLLYAQCGWYVLIHPAMIYVSHKYVDK
jgi:hypothetical protein